MKYFFYLDNFQISLLEIEIGFNNKTRQNIKAK